MNKMKKIIVLLFSLFFNLLLATHDEDLATLSNKIRNVLDTAYMSNDQNEDNFFANNFRQLLSNTRNEIRALGLDLNANDVKEILVRFHREFQARNIPSDGIRINLGYASPIYIPGIKELILSIIVPCGYNIIGEEQQKIVLITKLFVDAYKLLDIEFINYLLDNYSQYLSSQFLESYATLVVGHGTPRLRRSPRRMALSEQDALRLVGHDSQERIDQILNPAEGVVLTEVVLTEEERTALNISHLQHNLEDLEREIKQRVRAFIDERNR